jgi:hypothetical protein
MKLRNKINKENKTKKKIKRMGIKYGIKIKSNKNNKG